MQIIPQGEWILVTRKLRDTTSRGRIISYYKHEADARHDAKQCNERMPEWQTWAMRREDY